MKGMVLELLKQDSFFFSAQAALREQLLKGQGRDAWGSAGGRGRGGGKVPATRSLKSEMSRAVHSLGLKKQIRNLVWKLSGVISQSEASDDDPVPQVQVGRDDWLKSINDEIRAVATERQEEVAQELWMKGTGKSEQQGQMPSVSGNGNTSSDDDVSAEVLLKKKIRFIFDSEDLLDAMKRIEGTSNVNSTNPTSSYGILKLNLSTPSLSELRSKFSELHPKNFQVGIEDCLEDAERFVAHRQAVGKRVINEQYVPVARHYAKFGLLSSLRPKIYRCILGFPADISEQEKKHYSMLMNSLNEISYPIHDELFRMDTTSTINNDMAFFPFVEVITDVVLAFSRDPWVMTNSAVATHEPLHYTCQGGGVLHIPASGVHPFKGFVKYAAPLALVYDSRESM